MDGIPLDETYTAVEARNRGATRRQVLQDGVRVAHGLHVSSAFTLTFRRRCTAGARLLPPDAAFGLETAAVLLGAPVDPPDDVQVVLRPRPVLPQRAGLRVHVRGLHSEDVVALDGLRVTSGSQTFLDLAARMPPDELLAVGDSLARGKHLTRSSLDERLRRADRARGVVRARELAAQIDGRAASRPESRLRSWLRGER